MTGAVVGAGISGLISTYVLAKPVCDIQNIDMFEICLVPTP